MTEAPGRRWMRIAALSDFDEARKLVRQAGPHEVLLVRLGSEVVAVKNRCSHLGQPLDKGRVMSGQLTCPYHGACFDLRSGAVLSGPAVSGLSCYAVRLEGASILLALDDD